jgi:hypothetical protein
MMTRKFFTTLAIASIAASMLVGCKPSADDTTTPPATSTDNVKADQTPKPDATTGPATTPPPTTGTTSATPVPGGKPK